MIQINHFIAQYYTYYLKIENRERRKRHAIDLISNQAFTPTLAGKSALELVHLFKKNIVGMTISQPC